ncbi:MAG TPA: phospholipase D-like domain-containing protein [Candidatus Saccharimonadales bacterium]|nr:phospholipase D-like domain-containing protein [Candidatus Saccharimonadales bacterium]
MALSFNFYTTGEYFDELIGSFGAAGQGDSIRLASMAFDLSEPKVIRIIEELAAAAGRGADVSLAIDAYAFLNRDNRLPGPLFYRNKLPARMPKLFAARYEALKTIERAGGRLRIINLPGRRFTNPMGGRNHIKLALINSRVFVGGCNLNSSSHLDMMVGFEQKSAAKKLAGVFDKIMAAGSTEALGNTDVSFKVDAQTEIFIDSGAKKQSLIYNQAMGLLDKANRSVYMFCQYFPYGDTARHLAAAHQRGCDITLVYNHPSKHGRLHSFGHHAIIIKERASAPKSFFAGRLPKSTPYLHAKLIATDKAAILGSHNFVTAGVNLGTAELALVCKSSSFANKALRCINRQLYGSKPQEPQPVA